MMQLAKPSTKVVDRSTKGGKRCDRWRTLRGERCRSPAIDYWGRQMTFGEIYVPLMKVPNFWVPSSACTVCLMNSSVGTIFVELVIDTICERHPCLFKHWSSGDLRDATLGIFGPVGGPTISYSPT